MAKELKPERLLRYRAVTERTGLPRSTFYDLMRRNEFPAPVALAGRIVAWRESEVQQWIDARVERKLEGEPQPAARFPREKFAPKRRRGRPRKIVAAGVGS